MHEVTRQDTATAALDFADAILRIWDRNLDLVALVMEGHRELTAKESPRADPFASSSALQLSLDEARRGVDTPAIETAKLDLVRAVLRVWYKVQRHLQNQIFVAVRELAVKRGEDPDPALWRAQEILHCARHVDEVFAEKRKRLLENERRRERARAKRDADRMQRQLEAEVRQSA